MNDDTAYLAMRWLAAAIVLTTIGTARGTDQQGLGSAEEWSDVSGMVTDVSGAIVVQAEVLFHCGDAIVKTSTNQKGFSTKLRSGDCSVTVQASGFEIKTITDLQIHAPHPVILNIVLQIGSTRIVDGVFPQEIEPRPAELPVLLVEGVPATSRNCTTISRPDCREAVAFFDTFQKAVVRDKRDVVVSMARYPLRVQLEGRNVMIKNKSQLLSEYDRVFTAAVRCAIARGKRINVWGNWQGYTIADGVVWWESSALSNSHFKLITVNNGGFYEGCNDRK